MKKLVVFSVVLCSLFVGLLSVTATSSSVHAASLHPTSCNDIVVGDNTVHDTSVENHDSLYIEAQQHEDTNCSRVHAGGVFKATGSCGGQCDAPYTVDLYLWTSTSAGVPISSIDHGHWSLPNDTSYHGFGTSWKTNYCSNSWGQYFVTEAVLNDAFGYHYTAWSSAPANVSCVA